VSLNDRYQQREDIARIGMDETKTLATGAITSKLRTVPEDVRHEARRAILNYH
jgi:3-dehydroquinate synthetase